MIVYNKHIDNMKRFNDSIIKSYTSWSLLIIDESIKNYFTYLELYKIYMTEPVSAFFDCLSEVDK